jgi:ubiquinone/menaquinone biosynthesis C-methylase UbiE
MLFDALQVSLTRSIVLPLKNVSSTQKVASSTGELQDSYNRLYQEWLGEHRNMEPVNRMLSLMDVNSGKLLDAACGVGYLLDAAEARGALAHGLDISTVALKLGKKENPARKMVEGNGETLPWQGNTFDYVTCVGSLEHYIHPDVGAREIARVVKPDGLVAIMLPNSHNLLAIYNVWKTGGILPELQDFERFGTRVEWQALLQENGLQIVSTHKFNVGLSRRFKNGREGFWYLYNSLFRLFGEAWIPLNLSVSLIFICKKINAETSTIATHTAHNQAEGGVV